MSSKEILIKARELLKDHWCQKSYKEGDKFCALGAINYVSGDKHGLIPFAPDLEYWKARDSLSKIINNHSVVDFNDYSTHAEVIELFNQAINNA